MLIRIVLIFSAGKNSLSSSLLKMYSSMSQSVWRMSRGEILIIALV